MNTRPRATAIVVAGLGLAIFVFLVFGPTGQSNATTPDTDIITSSFTSAIDRGDTALVRWSSFMLIITVMGGIGIWLRRRVLVWASVVPLLLLSIAGAFTIGPFVSVVAVALLIVAINMPPRRESAA